MTHIWVEMRNPNFPFLKSSWKGHLRFLKNWIKPWTLKYVKIRWTSLSHPHLEFTLNRHFYNFKLFQIFHAFTLYLFNLLIHTHISEGLFWTNIVKISNKTIGKNLDFFVFNTIKSNNFAKFLKKIIKFLISQKLKKKRKTLILMYEMQI
jgi:hypothetical protein